MNLIINTDGGARGNPGPAATGYIIKDESGQILAEGGQYLGETTNNVAEYTAVLHALEALKELRTSDIEPRTINFYLDSQLVVKQLSGEYKIKKIHLQQLAQQIHSQLKQLQVQAEFEYVPRAQNAGADAKVNQTLDAQQV